MTDEIEVNTVFCGWNGFDARYFRSPEELAFLSDGGSGVEGVPYRRFSMFDASLQTASILFAIIGGTAAGVLSFLLWNVLRETPFGTVVALLSLTLSGVILYHVVLFVGGESVFLDTLRSAMHTIVAIFLWLVIATNEQIQQSVTKR